MATECVAETESAAAEAEASGWLERLLKDAEAPVAVAGHAAEAGAPTRARVTRVEGREIYLADAPDRPARRAASCLLAPRAGDLVYRLSGDCLSGDQPTGDRRTDDRGEPTYVLAVLERGPEGSERGVALEVDGDLLLRSTGGAVRVEAPDGDVSLAAGGAARIRGRRLALLAEEASWVARELSLLGERVSIDATRIRQVSTFAERVAESLKESFDRTVRDVRETEHVRAGALTLSLRRMLRAHAETAVVSAEKLIKLDGDQIHLG